MTPSEAAREYYAQERRALKREEADGLTRWIVYTRAPNFIYGKYTKVGCKPDDLDVVMLMYKNDIGTHFTKDEINECGLNGCRTEVVTYHDKD